MKIAMLMIGVATVYTGPVGNPLYCDRWDTEWMYDEAMMPWVALDVNLYRMGAVECGDPVRLTFEDGRELQARALDAGRFRGHYVEQWGGHRPIVVDVPAHLAPFPGWSAPVQMELGTR